MNCKKTHQIYNKTPQIYKKPRKSITKPRKSINKIVLNRGQGCPKYNLFLI